MLKVIEKEKPASIQELSRISGRNKGNLSRTLKNFQRHQIVDLIRKDRRKKPVALATRFDIQVGPTVSFDANVELQANSIAKD